MARATQPKLKKAADDPDNKAQDRDPAQNGGNHADDYLQQEQDESLIGVEPDVRVILFHKQAQKAQHGEIIQNADDLGRAVVHRRRRLIRRLLGLIGLLRRLLIRLLRRLGLLNGRLLRRLPGAWGCGEGF